MGGGEEGNSWEKGMPLCVQSKFECLNGCSGWQLVPVWDYSDAERILATKSLKPLLVNLQRMTSKPNMGGDSKDLFTWKVKEAVHYFVHADKVTTNSSTD